MAISGPERDSHYTADTYGLGPRSATDRWNVQREDQHQQQRWEFVNPGGPDGELSDTDVLSESLLFVVLGDGGRQLPGGTDAQRVSLTERFVYGGGFRWILVDRFAIERNDASDGERELQRGTPCSRYV